MSDKEFIEDLLKETYGRSHVTKFGLRIKDQFLRGVFTKEDVKEIFSIERNRR